YLFFNDGVKFFYPPQRHRNYLLSALDQLMTQPCLDTQSHLGDALTYLASTLHQRSMIIVLSDFMVSPFQDPLQRLSAKNEVILLHGYDDAERGSGIEGLFPARDPETGDYFLVNMNSVEVRKHLADNHRHKVTELETLAARSRADYLPLCVEDDYLARLVHFFGHRGS